MSNATVQVQGWTSSPQGRGSLDIFWTCFITLGLCSWSVVCVNIPSTRDTEWTKWRRKIWLTFISLIGPEWLLALALGQWSAARQSVEDFTALGYPEWTLRHGFYAEMGGFLLHTKDGEIFPLCNKSLLYLIREGFITDSMVREIIIPDTRAIKDKDKAGRLIRSIALAQALWFVINCLARFNQQLTVTTLELTVLGFFVPTAMTYYIWWHKPCDVNTADIVRINALTEDLLARGGPAAQQQWYRTPLDFVDREEWHGSITFRYWLNILKILVPFAKQEQSSRRTRRSDNDFLPTPVKYLFFLLSIPTLPFFGVYFIAWNGFFPTSIERNLWRGATIIMTTSFGIGSTFELSRFLLSIPQTAKSKIQSHHFELPQHQHKGLNESPVPPQSDTSFTETTYITPPSLLHHKFHSSIHRLKSKLRNNSPSKDPNLDVDLKLLFLATPLAFLYCICRFYIFVEDVIAFRSMPVDTYDTVQWIQFLPYFG